MLNLVDYLLHQTIKPLDVCNPGRTVVCMEINLQHPLILEAYFVCQWSNAPPDGMGGWSVAQSPTLRTTITWSRLRRRGYESMVSYYQKLIPEIQ